MNKLCLTFKLLFQDLGNSIFLLIFPIILLIFLSVIVSNNDSAREEQLNSTILTYNTELISDSTTYTSTEELFSDLADDDNYEALINENNNYILYEKANEYILPNNINVPLTLSQIAFTDYFNQELNPKSNVTYDVNEDTQPVYYIDWVIIVVAILLIIYYFATISKILNIYNTRYSLGDKLNTMYTSKMMFSLPIILVSMLTYIISYIIINQLPYVLKNEEYININLVTFIFGVFLILIYLLSLNKLLSRFIVNIDALAMFYIIYGLVIGFTNGGYAVLNFSDNYIYNLIFVPNLIMTFIYEQTTEVARNSTEVSLIAVLLIIGIELAIIQVVSVVKKYV